MKLLIDMVHPADVHLFRNFIRIMQEKGHSPVVTARDKDVTLDLLKGYGIPHYNLGKPGCGRFSKTVKMVVFFGRLLRLIVRHKPRLLISCSSPSLAQAGFLLRIPHIVFGDTEHAGWAYRLSVPFSRWFISPRSFSKDYGKKHLRYRGYHELAYLHPRYFRPDSQIRRRLGVGEDEKYCLLRFVAWRALHDRGLAGWELDVKRDLCHQLSRHARIFIIAEDPLPEDFAPFLFPLSPGDIHHAQAQAYLLISEGASTASEGAILGIPTIYVNPLVPGYLRELQSHGLVHCLKNLEEVIRQAIEWFQEGRLKEEFQQRRDKMLEDKIDVTDFMVRLVENFPRHADMMNTRPRDRENFSI